MADSPIEAVLIHAVYLLNCASEDAEIRAKSLASLIHSLRVGDAIGAAGVVLHPGSALRGDVGEAIARAGEVISEALAETDACPLHLENTAGAGGTLGRSFEELAALIEAARRRRAARRLPRLLPPARVRLRHPHRRGAGATTLERVRRASSGSTASARCTSTTRRRRSAPTATATPTSARASSARRAARRSCPSRASRGCRSCWRRPAPTAEARAPRKSRYAFELRERGLAARGI